MELTKNWGSPWHWAHFFRRLYDWRRGTLYGDHLELTVPWRPLQSRWIGTGKEFILAVQTTQRIAYLDGSMVNGSIGSVWCFALENKSTKQLKKRDSENRRNSFVRCLGPSRYLARTVGHFFSLSFLRFCFCRLRRTFGEKLDTLTRTSRKIRHEVSLFKPSGATLR